MFNTLQISRRAGLAVVALAWIAVAAPPASAATLLHGPSKHVCSSPRKHRAACQAVVMTHADGVTPYSSLSPVGYGPAQFHSAYSEPTLTPYVTCCTGPHKSVTIAIVDAYDNASIVSDLAAYDAAFGLPDFPSCGGGVTTSCLQIVNQTGDAAPLPAQDDNWGLEEDLDVQAAHAMCQNCKILL